MSTEHDIPERFTHVSIFEYNETAADYDREPGKRRIAAGVQRDRHVYDEDEGDFVQVADGVAVIELYQPLTDDEITEWCNSPAGKLALAHWFDEIDPDEVVEQ